MNRYTFTRDTVIIDGKSYPATYDGRGSAIIARFAGRQLVLTPKSAQYVEAAHAFAAAIRTDEKLLASALLQIVPPALFLVTPQSRRTSDDEAFELAEFEALGLAAAESEPEGPELLAAGQGWRFILDTEHQRTRLVFDTKPGEKVLQLIEAARFFWSPNMQSYNKKLTQKARRAALALAAELERIAA